MKIFEEYNPEDEREILAEFSDADGNEYFFLLENRNNEISFATKTKQGIKSFKDFIRNHPYLSGVAFTVGMEALDAYKQNKLMTTRFFAKTPMERKMYQDMVDQLTKSGKYQLLKKKRIHGGTMWELKKKR